MSASTELIARLRLGASISRERKLNQGYDAVADEAADAIEALEAEVERLGMALHGYQVAIETAEESLKDRVALVMEVDRLSAAGVSHCGHRPPCVECSKYAAPIPQQTAPSVPEGWKLVPIELTEAMEDAAEKAESRHVIADKKRTGGKDPQLSFKAAYAAMLAAAPQPKDMK